MTERLPFHFSLSCIGDEMATHSSVLAWRIPGTEEPGGLPSMGSHRVGHNWSNLAAAAAALCWYININQPQAYICSLPPISHPSRLSQSTGLSSLCHIANSHWLSILHMVVYVFPMPLSQFIPPSPSPTVFTSLLSMSASPLLLCK